MESLRWVLLAAGIVFVLVIYMLGRSRYRRNHSHVDELEASQEDMLPEFSAKNLDDVDEGVGKVRIISGAGLLAADEEYLSSVKVSAEDLSIDDDSTSSKQQHTEPSESKAPTDFIVLYILPKGDPNEDLFLLGSQINSSAQAMGLSFAEMNIFHYKSNGRNVFSLANMLEPGSFDVDTIHDLKTTGLTVFMQIQQGDPLDDLTEMLQRSYQLAGLLGARLCNHKRQTLTEQDAEDYRKQVRGFINNATAELSSET
ncbi:MAG: cell division protein ZipA C-terminal FtsZ-binding domain-containing protein [Gammaproteobacteria bacterium]